MKARTVHGFTYQIPGVPASSKLKFFFAKPKAVAKAAKLADRGYEVSPVTKAAYSPQAEAA